MIIFFLTGSISPTKPATLVENLLSLTRWHCDDANRTRILSISCLPNSHHRAKGSPVAHIVITKTHITNPHSLFFFFFVLSFFSPINFHRHHSQSCQSFSPCSLPHSPPVKLPGGFPVTGWQGGAAVGPACLYEMFIWSGELTGLTAHPHRAFVM